MERAGRLIGKLKLPASAVSPEELAKAAWAAAVGKKIAAHSTAISLVRGCILVEVEDAVWQRQLTTLRSQIVRRLQEITGTEIVRDVAFRPMIPKRMPQRAETARPQEFQLTADDADSIADPILRRLYKTSRKKATA
jgi:predicted nucleic acid-binding Zn ribbon protein